MVSRTCTIVERHTRLPLSQTCDNESLGKVGEVGVYNKSGRGKAGRMRRLVLILMVVAVMAPGAYADVSITVYNQNLGLVTDTRSFDLSGGMQSMTMTGVAAQIVPTSVRIDFPGSNVDIYEQNYHYDLVNTGAILQRYLDRNIRLVLKEDRVFEGTLLSAGPMYVLQTTDGLQLINAGEVIQVDLAELPDGFYTRPTLEWLVGTRNRGSANAEVSYLTNGINWHAEYVAHLNEDDTKLDLSGWASIDNQTGATYKDAKLKLIAGDIHRAPRGRGPIAMDAGVMEMSAMGAPKAGFDERSFFEYHLYDLPRRTTVANKEVKQIALFEPSTASVVKKYKYRPYKDQKKVAVVVELMNSEENGLGIPLPKGLVRLTKSDIDGSSQLLGEDRIDHTPKDEELTFEVGNAFDLTAEMTTLDQRRISRTVSESDVQIKLRNHKTEAVEIVVEQKAYRWSNWRIIQASSEYEKVDADTFRFVIEVEPDGEAVVTYTLRTGV